MTAAKLVPLVLYFLMLFAIGIVASRRVKNLKDFFVAGKSLNFWLVAFSSRATGESGWLLLGLTGMGFSVGMQAWWVVVGELMGVTICWGILTQRFKVFTDKYDCVTVTDYLEDRLGDRTRVIRVIATLCLVVFVTAYVSAQFAACGKAFTGFLGWDHSTGVVLGMVIVGFYSVAGGFIAVVWSDLVQGSLMLVGLIVMPIVGLVAAGGPTAALTKVAAIDPDLVNVWGAGGFSAQAVVAAAGLVAIGFGYLGSPQLFVRFISVRSPREFRNGSAVATLFTLLADAGAVATGIVGRALYDGVPALADSEQILPHMAGDLLPAVVGGILMAVVLAAIMSTADSLLVLVSSAVVRDVWQKMFRPNLDEVAAIKLCRYVTVAVLVFSSAWAFDKDSVIFWFVLFAWTGITTSFCPAILTTLFWRGATTAGVAAGMVTGLGLTIGWKLGRPHLDNPLLKGLDEMLVAFFASLLVIIVVSKLTTPPEHAEADLAEVRGQVYDVWRG